MVLVAAAAVGQPNGDVHVFRFEEILPRTIVEDKPDVRQMRVRRRRTEFIHKRSMYDDVIVQKWRLPQRVRPPASSYTSTAHMI